MLAQSENVVVATSLKLSKKLKSAVTVQAKRAKMSVHAYMTEALRRQVSDDQLRSRFVNDALLAESGFHDTGRAYEFGEVRVYLERKLTGRRSRRPRLRK
ncbi:MAG: hypothetical protein ACKVPX_14050 [Myxococcaceae bacterium]